MTGAVILWSGYRDFYGPNVIIPGDRSTFLYIPTGSDFSKVDSILEQQHFIKNEKSFVRVARIKKYMMKVRPGKYRIRNGMSNNDLVNLLRSGKQEPVNLVFVNVMTLQELAGKVAGQIEADSAGLLRLMKDVSYLHQFQVTPSTVMSLFIPNTYQFFWNTSANQFMKRMFVEKKRFWNDERRQKCMNTGMHIPEVIVLASIIERETTKDDEKPVIAGVYMNRYRKGWALQADPTLIFAWNDYSIKRVLDKHKKINSPYNTYLHTGLPPGPICLPSIASIDAVLNYRHHSYMYFCAKEDLSGYHNFAVTLAEHNRNARRYQMAIDRLGLK